MSENGKNNQMLRDEYWDPKTSPSLPPTRWAAPPNPVIVKEPEEHEHRFGRFAEHWRRRDILRHIKAKPRELYPDAESLLMGCIEYFDWNINNPVLATHVAAYKGETTKTEVERIRAPSIRGLVNRLGISTLVWEEWRETDVERRDVCRWAENMLHTIKFEAAAADLINPTIAMRDLGLGDKLEAKVDITEDKTVTQYELPQNNRPNTIIDAEFKDVADE